MLLEYLNLICQTIIDYDNGKQTWRIDQTLGDTELFYYFLQFFNFKKRLHVIDYDIEVQIGQHTELRILLRMFYSKLLKVVLNTDQSVQECGKGLADLELKLSCRNLIWKLQLSSFILKDAMQVLRDVYCNQLL